MNIYQIQKNRDRRAERYAESSEISGLKIAAGGEDIVTLTAEAINSFRRENTAKNREQGLIELALKHINDDSPVLEGIKNDPEFMMAERLALLAELAIRVAPSAKGGNVYGRITGFVIEQLIERK